MSEECKVLATRIVQEIWNEGNLDLTDQIIAPDNADNVAGDGSPVGPDGFKQAVAGIKSAFPDFSITGETPLFNEPSGLRLWHN